MSRKDYEAMATALRVKMESYSDTDRYVTAREAVRQVAGALADVFAADNPRFDRKRFMKAAGL